MKRSLHKFYQRGVSLVELSVALVIFGVALLVLWQVGANQSHQQNGLRSSNLLERAQTNLTVYAALHGRLPCPAKDVQGLETCGDANAQYLPYLTLGLPDPGAGHMLYAVPLGLPGLTGGALFSALMPDAVDFQKNMAVQTTLLAPLVVTSATTAYDHVVDLCAALSGKGQGTGGRGSAAESPAYSLAADASAGLGPLATGWQSRLVSRGQLRGQLQCAAILANAGRGHFNARLASATMARTLYDFQTQSGMAQGNAMWDLASNAWSFTNNVYGGIKASRTLALATSKYIASESTDVTALKAMLWANASLLTMAAGVVGQISQLIVKDKGIKDGQANLDLIDVLVSQSLELDAVIQQHAVLNSSSFFFLAQQGHLPVPRNVVTSAMPGPYAAGGPLGAAANQARAQWGFPLSLASRPGQNGPLSQPLKKIDDDLAQVAIALASLDAKGHPPSGAIRNKLLAKQTSLSQMRQQLLLKIAGTT